MQGQNIVFEYPIQVDLQNATSSIMLIPRKGLLAGRFYFRRIFGGPCRKNCRAPVDGAGTTPDYGELEPPEFRSTVNLQRKGNSDHGPSFLPSETQTMVRVNCQNGDGGWFLGCPPRAQGILAEYSSNVSSGSGQSPPVHPGNRASTGRGLLPRQFQMNTPRALAR